MTNTPPIAAAATALLHAALLVAVINGLALDPKREPASEPVKVQLLAPSPATLPVAQSAPQPPLPVPPAPPVPKKERSIQKPPTETRAPDAAKAGPGQAPDITAPSSPQPAASTTQAAPAPVTGLPAAPSAPARTSASEASYASTNRIPPYPRISAMSGDEGTVILRVLVTAEGTTGAVEVKVSSGHGPLDESARKAVQTWRFKPATVDGKPVAEWYQVPIPFKLQNN
jgi:periplasmic protein TonB